MYQEFLTDLNPATINILPEIIDFERDSNQVVYIYYDSIVVMDSTSNQKIPLNNDLIGYEGPIGCKKYIDGIDSMNFYEAPLISTKTTHA